jgi:ADP-ribosylglycohydrolase
VRDRERQPVSPGGRRQSHAVTPGHAIGAEDRIRGSLTALACGDAIGKQTEGLSHDDVRRWYPDGVRGFEGPPGTVIPRYVGNRKHEWCIGETTDDTERTIAVARAILRDGDVRHASVGHELLACTKCVHPGIASLWEFHQHADPARVTQDHNGCGAAVRVAPIGILYRSHRLDDLVAGAREASISTHGGPFALAAAAATAAAVSAAIDGAEADAIGELAQRAAARAECDRSGSTESVFERAMRTMHADLRERRRRDRLHAADVATTYFPNDPLTIVPLALAIAVVMDSADEAILLATNVGGDSDSVASVAGAVLGARYPHTINDDWVAMVETVNGHGLTRLVADLSRLRG